VFARAERQKEEAVPPGFCYVETREKVARVFELVWAGVVLEDGSPQKPLVVNKI